MRSFLQAFLVVTVVLVGASSGGAALAQSFVNWESPHVNPLDITPDGSKLLAVNTADNRLEVFTLGKNGPAHAGSIPVGLDPVSVRARTNTEAWVVNQISDSVSIVDLPTLRVKATLLTGDEPADVVFAGSPQRAFVSIAQLNQVRVFDPADLSAAPTIINIQGEEPRALATDGVNVYAAIFESGNRTTILPEASVNSAAFNPYPGDPNPPPNNFSAISPPLTPGLPTPPRVSLIVKRDAGANIWRDDNPSGVGIWTSAVAWNVHDNDVAVINGSSLAVSYVKHLMNLNMNLSVKPGGQIAVVGTDAINHVRFEPNVRGKFLRVVGATFSAGGSPTGTIVDLNPHLDYSSHTIAPNLRAQSIGDPRGIAWRADGQRAFIAGMGSNNVIVVDGNLGRIGLIEVGQGPTGVAFDDDRGLVYVLNKFEATISVIDDQSLIEVDRISMHDPTPMVIKAGRPHLYDTHATSGLGHTACASCHVDGRMDQLAWDLGDPAGAMKTFNQVCQLPIPGACGNWHPMKGPMTTQTLVGINGTEPLHWRGDRENLAAFNPAFVGLMGADGPLTGQQMNEFTAFIGTIKFPPQPNRNLDNSLPTTFAATGGNGNPQTGETRFMTQLIDGGLVSCNSCHAVPSGTNGQITPAQAIQETQSMKIPQLRNMYRKNGLSLTSQNNARGFGFIHDGSVDNLFSFLQFGGFQFAGGNADQQRRDIEAFLLCFPTNTHAGVGAQVTIANGAAVPAPQQALLNQFVSLANAGSVGLVVKGRVNDEQRGWTFMGAAGFQSDRAAQTHSAAALLALAGAGVGSELTYTLVPAGSQIRIGIDRDQDGYFDRDEIDGCADPADASSVPGDNLCRADIAPQSKSDSVVNVDDLLVLLANWGVAAGGPGSLGDLAPGCGDGLVNVDDLLMLLAAWGPCP